jgi:DNA-binding transcriptional LysR family regulator
MLDLHRLLILQRFATHGTIAATAAALGYSPSAVSQQLATLEREAGAQLLDRTARSAELTDVGRRLADHAGRVLAGIEEAEADLAAQAGRPSGRVVLSAFPTAAVALSPALATVRQYYPDVEVVVRQASRAEALARLRTRETDVAIVDDWRDGSLGRGAGFEDVTLVRDPLVLALPRGHHLADRRRRLDLATTERDAWICAPAGEPSREAFERVLARAGVRASTVWEFEGLATIAVLVSRGVGIAVLPKLAITSHLRRGIVEPV